MMLALYRQLAEGSMVCGARLAFGDERVADALFSQPYNAGFVGRHTHQLGGLLCSKMDAATEEETASNA